MFEGVYFTVFANFVHTTSHATLHSPSQPPKAKPLMNKFRKKAKKRANQAKRKAQKKRRATQLDWSSSSSESDGSDVEWNEQREMKGSEQEHIAMDPLTQLLQEHLPKATLLDETLRLSPMSAVIVADRRRQRRRTVNNKALSVNPTDTTVRQAAMDKLQYFHREASALVIQTAYRKWTSRQMVIGWVGFSQMQIEDSTAQDSIAFVPPPNAFQERLSDRAFKRLQKRQLRLVFKSWYNVAHSFVRCRERMLTCYFASKMSKKMVGWLRVVKRQMALKKVVYIQERLVR